MPLNNIISRNFPSINALSISLVENTEPKEFHTRYFFFIKAIPSVKSETSSTGRSYDMKSSITLKMEAEKALGLSFALNQYANGKGKVYEEVFGNFTIFADSSKSQYGGNEKKSMIVSLGSNNKTGKALINMFFAEGEKKIPFFLSPYEAYSISKVLEVLAEKCIEMEMSGGGIVVRKPKPPTQQQKPYVPQQVDEFSDPFQEPAPEEKKEINKVTNQFNNFFTNDPFESSFQ